MTALDETRKAAEQFVKDWTGRGDEKQDTQNFWNQLLRTVYGVDTPEQYIKYEKPVAKGFIDGYIADTKVLIEQKGIGHDLDAKESRQGKMVTPYEQARDYVSQLGLKEKPHFIITCNFQTFRVYNCNEDPQYNRKTDIWYAPFEELKLEDLADNFQLMSCLVNPDVDKVRREMKISIGAGKLVRKLYNSLYTEFEKYGELSEKDLKCLNELCVRLVFLFYAEDAGVLGEKDMFVNYINQFDAASMRDALKDLFKVLDTKKEDRDKFMREDLKRFPYVNGNLFASKELNFPQFTEEIKNIIVEDCSLGFDWSGISPAIFGAVFESTLNPETRREGGMHYTNVENIHKVIDPLFLDGLKEELQKVKEAGSDIKVRNAARRFQDKLSKLKFLDPAAGSGNFLTETYICIRRLENEALKLILGDQVGMLLNDIQDPIKVTIDQFYGIEINNFAVSVAKTAMWIAESQMMHETQQILHSSLDFLPLKTNVNIVEANALTIDWNDVVPAWQLSYIIGNPPFVGYSNQTKEQKECCREIFKGNKKAGKLDFVTCWFRKAHEYIGQCPVRAAFVSTNSICQGEQVATLWKDLFNEGLHIDFAYRSFKWTNEADGEAQVSVIVIGFSRIQTSKERIIFDGEDKIAVKNINAYLIDGEDVFVESRRTPLRDVPPAVRGFQATDGGWLILDSPTYEKVKNIPEIAKWIKPFSMGADFIKGTKRYCLWLKGISPKEIKECSFIKDRVEKVREMRMNSKKEATKRDATIPHLFQEWNKPINLSKPYIAIPKVSSIERKYIPIGFVDNEMVPGDKLFVIQPNKDALYLFGVIISTVHISFADTTMTKLGDGRSYTNTISYNNFPWPEPTPEQKTKIEQTAQAIFDARNLYPDSSLADLYDPLTMPKELRDAHKANDKAVMEAYGFSQNMTESEIVAELMKMYQKLTEEEK